MYSIYKLVWEGRPEVYVGCSKNPEQRLSQHTGPSAAPKVRDAVARLGAPTMVILDEGLDLETARTKETWHIHDLCASVEWMGGLNTVVANEQPTYTDKIEVIKTEVVRVHRIEKLQFPPGEEGSPEYRAQLELLARRRKLAEQLVAQALPANLEFLAARFRELK